MSYAIFRSQPINTIGDLSQIGSHNKRDKKAYKSNPDINVELSSHNIELVPCNGKYVKKFYEITIKYKEEHEEKMKTTRQDRQKTFRQAVDSSKSVVADEMLFTSDSAFFKDMSKEEIIRWANCCMDFVYNDLGYTKEQVLHAILHLDEKTPHIHCVVVPLIKKYDKRTNTERYSISKKQYIRDKIHLSELQDKYYQRMLDNNFDLQRGIKGSDREHLTVKEFKKVCNNLDKKLEQENKELMNSYKLVETKMKNAKPTIIANQVKIDKETYDSLNNFMNTAKKVIKETPKNKVVYNELRNYISSYKEIKRENQNIMYEINILKSQNEKLYKENNRLLRIIDDLLCTLKVVFRKILKLGTEQDKKDVVTKITNYYDNKLYITRDLYDIANNTTKEQEIKAYINKNRDKNYER